MDSTTYLWCFVGPLTSFPEFQGAGGDQHFCFPGLGLLSHDIEGCLWKKSIVLCDEPLSYLSGIVILDQH